MLDKLSNIQARFEEVVRLMASPEVASDYSQLEALAKERKTLEKAVVLYKKYSLVEEPRMEETCS